MAFSGGARECTRASCSELISDSTGDQRARGLSHPSKDASSEATDDKKTKRSRKTRRSEDAPGLRKETIEHPVSERVRRCPHCGGRAEPIGTGKFTTEWEYVPGYFVCRRHIQEVVACRCGQHIARAEAPLRAFDRTQYGPGLMLSHRQQVRRCDAHLPRREALRATRRPHRPKHTRGSAPDIDRVRVDGGKRQYRRPTYAGNALAWLEIATPVHVVSVRQTEFTGAEAGETGAGVSPIENVAKATDDPAAARIAFMGLQVGKSERPDSARLVSSSRVGARSRSNTTPCSCR